MILRELSGFHEYVAFDAAKKGSLKNVDSSLEQHYANASSPCPPSNIFKANLMEP